MKMANLEKRWGNPSRGGGQLVEPLFRIHGSEWKCLSGKWRTKQVLDGVGRGGFAI